MARKTTKQASTPVADQTDDAPVLDTSNTAVKALIKKGKERGFVTHDELNSALPQGELTSEQIEDVMASLSQMGVNVVEATDDVDADDSEAEAGEGRASGNLSDNEVGGSDDPVRMYLREMGSVELLSREGEIAIAKRIEAGREMMIGGICESPLAIRALLTWTEQVRDGVVPLRDIIDLDLTFVRLNGSPIEDNSSAFPPVRTWLLSMMIIWMWVKMMMMTKRKSLMMKKKAKKVKASLVTARMKTILMI